MEETNRELTTKQKALKEAKQRFPNASLKKLGEIVGYAPGSVYSVTRANTDLANDLDRIQAEIEENIIKQMGKVQVKYDLVLDKEGIDDKTLQVCKQVQDTYVKRTEPIQPQSVVNIEEMTIYQRNILEQKTSDKTHYVNNDEEVIDNGRIAEGSQFEPDDDDDD